eukprot:TRINITY_DN19155_c0_g1_i1.p1 TRINITY_DN19155_c0_g1~~TRINITY_DN19155_c0_g1_i1.p1  ORF type:complete len:233 (-),score=30.27 TRINITY_DN19155_c0_g1_i1:166-864(-)
MPVLDVVLGNLLTLVVLSVLYLSYQIVAPYFLVCLYALLLSEALQRPKRWLVRITRGWLGHSATTGILMLGSLAGGTVLVAAMLTLSMQDLISAQRIVMAGSFSSDSSFVGLNLSTENLEAWGAAKIFNSTLTYAQAHYASLEAQYSETPWWPLVEEMVVSLRSLEASNLTESFSSDGEINLLPALDVQSFKRQGMEFWDLLMAGDDKMRSYAQQIWEAMQHRQPVIHTTVR